MDLTGELGFKKLGIFLALNGVFLDKLTSDCFSIKNAFLTLLRASVLSENCYGLVIRGGADFRSFMSIFCSNIILLNGMALKGRDSRPGTSCGFKCFFDRQVDRLNSFGFVAKILPTDSCFRGVCLSRILRFNVLALKVPLFLISYKTLSSVVSWLPLS